MKILVRRERFTRFYDGTIDNTCSICLNEIEPVVTTRVVTNYKQFIGEVCRNTTIEYKVNIRFKKMTVMQNEYPSIYLENTIVDNNRTSLANSQFGEEYYILHVKDYENGLYAHEIQYLEVIN